MGLPSIIIGCHRENGTPAIVDFAFSAGGSLLFFETLVFFALCVRRSKLAGVPSLLTLWN